MGRVSKLRQSLIYAGTGLLVALTLANFSSLIRLLGPAIYPEAAFRFECDRKLTTLTIDDGPAPGSTQQILDVLAENDVKATFFIIGERAEQHPDLVEAIANQGHELANHTYEERTTARLNEPELSQSIGKTQNILSTHQTPQWFRPGTGFYNNKILQAIQPYDYKLALGDVFPFDTIITSSAFHAWYINHSVRPGSIIVMHDANDRGERTAETLTTIIPKLQAQGYEWVTLQELSRSCHKVATH